MSFSQPIYLSFLLLPLLLIAWYFFFAVKRETAVRVSFGKSDEPLPQTWRTRMVHVPFLLKILAVVALIFALARPQTDFAISDREVEGIDIMLSLDISVSMLTPDFEPNRIEAAKQVAQEFISNRPSDNIGLTVFGGEAYTQCPLTTDHATLLSMFSAVGCELQQDGIINQGTAIGMGIANAVAHLETSNTKSKIIILLTDGENNTGEISPITAAELAKNTGIRVYTISVGTDGARQQQVATLPNGEAYQATLAAPPSDDTLKKIASITGGTAYSATDLQSLRNIYREIDELEKTKMKVTQHQQKYEAFQPFALAAFFIYIIAMLLQFTLFKKLP